MKTKTAEECISRILRDIEKRRSVDYADKKSVRRYNAAIDRIMENANYLCDNYPDQMELFIALVRSPDYSISATCTSILYYLHGSTLEFKRIALGSARQLLLHPDANEVEQFIWRVNIQRWEAELTDAKQQTMVA